MRIIFARQSTLASLAIRLFTWSNFSHVALVFGSDVIEVTAKHGVIRRPAADFIAAQSKCEVAYVDCDEAAAEAFAMAQLGKRYDWTAIFGFIFRSGWTDGDKWFCSELTESAIRAGGLCRFREELSRITPRDVWMVTPAPNECT